MKTYQEILSEMSKALAGRYIVAASNRTSNDSAIAGLNTGTPIKIGNGEGSLDGHSGHLDKKTVIGLEKDHKTPKYAHEVPETHQRIAKRLKKIALATDKLTGEAKVPATEKKTVKEELTEVLDSKEHRENYKKAALKDIMNNLLRGGSVRNAAKRGRGIASAAKRDNPNKTISEK